MAAIICEHNETNVLTIDGNARVYTHTLNNKSCAHKIFVCMLPPIVSFCVGKKSLLISKTKNKSSIMEFLQKANKLKGIWGDAGADRKDQSEILKQAII